MALSYEGGEGSDGENRNGIHIYGGRQEGKYINSKDLKATHGCLRINDQDIADLKQISGMVRKCIMASGLSDPTIDSEGDGEWKNGVALLANGKGVKKVDVDQIRNGDLITLDTSRGKGVDGGYDHIGIIVDVASDGTISFVRSGSNGPQIGTYNKNGSGYWDTRA